MAVWLVLPLYESMPGSYNLFPSILTCGKTVFFPPSDLQPVGRKFTAKVKLSGAGAVRSTSAVPYSQARSLMGITVVPSDTRYVRSDRKPFAFGMSVFPLRVFTPRS